MNEEQLYINFNEYIKASEPHKRLPTRNTTPRLYQENRGASLSSLCFRALLLSCVSH